MTSHITAAGFIRRNGDNQNAEADQRRTRRPRHTAGFYPPSDPAIGSAPAATLAPKIPSGTDGCSTRCKQARWHRSSCEPPSDSGITSTTGSGPARATVAPQKQQWNPMASPIAGTLPPSPNDKVEQLAANHLTIPQDAIASLLQRLVRVA